MNGREGQTGRYFELIWPAEEVYPSSEVNFSDGTERFSGIENIEVLDKLRNLLIDGGVFYMSWSPWPNGGVTDEEVVIQDFQQPYEKCRDHVLGKN